VLVLEVALRNDAELAAYCCGQALAETAALLVLSRK